MGIPRVEAGVVTDSKIAAVIDDLMSRSRAGRLRSWRRMVESYAAKGLIRRRQIRCPSCGRLVDLVCSRCLGTDEETDCSV